MGKNLKGDKYPLAHWLGSYRQGPDEDKGKQQEMTFAANTIEGILVGYHLNSEGSWKGEYEVCALEDLRGKSLIHTADPKTTNVLPQHTSRVVGSQV